MLQNYGHVGPSRGLSVEEGSEKPTDRTAQRSAAGGGTNGLELDDTGFTAAVLDAMPGVLYVHDENLRFLRWNCEFARVAGYTDEEIARLSPLDLFAAPDKDLLASRIREVFAAGASSVEADLVTKDGRHIPCYFTGVRARIGEARCLVGVGIDISARKAAEEALRAGEQRLRLALEAAHIGTFDWDVLTGRITWSRWHEEMWGFAPGEFDGTYEAFAARVHPDDLPGVSAQIERCMRERTRYEKEFRVVWPDGSVHWINGRGEFSFGADGTPERMCGVVVETTARREAEEEVRRLNRDLERRVRERTAELEKARDRAEDADKVKSAFLATMSHELRTPLNSAIGFTGILLQELAGPLNDEQRKQLGMVQNSARHLLALINDVLDISKIEAGELTVQREWFHVAPLVNRVVAAVRPLAEEKGLALHLEQTEPPGQLESDERRVEQVLLNLLGNAVKFTERGQVLLRVEAVVGPDAALRFSVADSGVGIEAQDVERVFEPFRQLEDGSARSHKGTGLGLAICRRLADLLGGELTVCSEPGRGSVFTFELPRRAAEI